VIIRIHKQVLRLNISVTDAKSVQVCQCSKALVHVELDEKHRHRLLHLCVVLQNSVDGLRHIVHDNVQVYFVLFFALSVKGMS